VGPLRPHTGTTSDTESGGQGSAERSGVDPAKWTWKGVRQYVQEQFHLLLSSRTCLKYLHRLGFVLKQPKKCFVKANAEKRKAFCG
jgi:transposase